MDQDIRVRLLSDRDGDNAGDAGGAVVLQFPGTLRKPSPVQPAPLTPAAIATAANATAATKTGADAAKPAQAMLFQLPVRASRTMQEAKIIEQLRMLALEGARDGKPNPTTLALAGGFAGFAAQQSLMLRGGPYWGQPMRAAHLDRMLISTDAEHASLWLRSREVAQSLGQMRLPDPSRLLMAAQKCIGTTQLGVITPSAQYRLTEQPQTGVTRVWARVRSMLGEHNAEPATWPGLTARAAALHLGDAADDVPPAVAIRIIMQAALGMALIEPRQIPGAAVRSA